jgi:hypothetical protein
MSQTFARPTLKAFPRHLEKRKHNRVKVVLLGRYMLANRQEFACRTIDISPGGLTLMAPVQGEIGEKVIVYLEQIGRLEGEITRTFNDGFGMKMTVTPRKRDKLGDQLTWLANRHALGLPEDRRHERVIPRNLRTTLTIEDGREYVVRIVDLSQSGVALKTDIRPPLSSPAKVGHKEGKVVRYIEAGIAIEFRQPIDPEIFDEAIIL